jgi:hypothetical protein
VEQDTAGVAGVESVSPTVADTLAVSGEPSFSTGPDSAAVAGATDPSDAGPQRWRGLVFSDSEVFSDAVLYNLVQNRAILADGARWLGRDEDLAGTTESEADVRIVHTRAEQVAWFYTIIAGAPFLVLTGGLLGVRLRRRSRGEA